MLGLGRGEQAWKDGTKTREEREALESITLGFRKGLGLREITLGLRKVRLGHRRLTLGFS